MAIYHLSTKPISRGQGRSATAAAAYRSRELVHDLTTDEVFDYTRKRGVEHTEIVLPTAAAKMDINWLGTGSRSGMRPSLSGIKFPKQSCGGLHATAD